MKTKEPIPPLDIHIDFETYSEADLKKVGAWAYSCHPSTEVICAAYCIDDGEVEIVKGHDEVRKHLDKEIFSFDALFHAHNSFFEYAITINTLKVAPPLISRWRDTAAQAAALALPRSLGRVCQVLNLPEELAKDKRGRYLIQRLSKPYRGGRCKDEELLEELCEYCKQDVIAEREVSKRLRPLSDSEQKVWELDQIVNIRGLNIDMEGVDNALKIRDLLTGKLNKVVEQITNGALKNVSQRDLVMQYIDENLGYFLDKYDKNYLRTALEDPQLPELARKLIEIRLQLGKTSISKYDALKNIVTDGRAHGLLMYHGASTGRWSGKLFQPQNLPRPTIKDPEVALEMLGFNEIDFVETLYDDVSEVLSSCVRSVISAPLGKDLVVADYSQIEARCLPWLARQHTTLEVFRQNKEIYKHEASKIYKKPVHEITDDERFIGKVAVLALGYQGGARAFQNMAAIYNVEIPESQAEKIKNEWRSANKKIVNYWYDINSAAINAVKNPGEVFIVNSVGFRKIKQFLFCKLPSGRLLSYVNAHIGTNAFGSECVCFYGLNSVTGKWVLMDTYGGKLVENITQAVARDIMTEAALRVEDKGYEMVLSVHDEIVTEKNEGEGSLEEFENLLCAAPKWAKDLPIAAKSYRSKRYRK